ncbi:MAG: hypothetical protein O2840_05125 [bacterium]|nr:hypothetical protein [bacterium]
MNSENTEHVIDLNSGSLTPNGEAAVKRFFNQVKEDSDVSPNDRQASVSVLEEVVGHRNALNIYCTWLEDNNLIADDEDDKSEVDGDLYSELIKIETKGVRTDELTNQQLRDVLQNRLLLMNAYNEVEDIMRETLNEVADEIARNPEKLDLNLPGQS